MLWGFLIAIASFVTFFIGLDTKFKYTFIPFPISAAVGVIMTTIFYYRRVSASTFSYLTNFLYSLWLVLGISFFIVVFVSVSQNQVPFTYTLIIAAIGTLSSGLVMNFRPLVAGGILFFVAAIGTIYVPVEYKVLIHGTAFVLGYLVPGYLLKSKS